MKRLVAYHSFRLLLILPNYPVLVQILGSDSFVIFSLLSVILHCNCGGHRSQTLIWSRYCWLTAGARMGSGWWCRNVICISMSRHSSRCFVAYSFEIRRHNFHRKDNKHGKTSFSQGRMYNEVWGGGCIVPGDATPCCSCCVCCRSCFLTFEEKRPHKQQQRKGKCRAYYEMRTIAVGCRWLHL